MFKIDNYKGKGMKATMEFNLDEEYDCHVYKVMNSAQDLVQALQEFDQKLRAMHKYEDVADAYNYREILRSILDEHNVVHLL